MGSASPRVDLFASALTPTLPPACARPQYYKHTPTTWKQHTHAQAGSESGPLPWDKLYARMAARTQPRSTLAGQDGYAQVRGAMAALRGQQQQPPQQQGQGQVLPPLYEFYHITRLSSRVWGGHGAFWSIDPHNPEALAAAAEVSRVKQPSYSCPCPESEGRVPAVPSLQDLTALAHLWASWAKADATAPPLPSPLLEECKEISAIRAQVRALVA